MRPLREVMVGRRMLPVQRLILSCAAALMIAGAACSPSSESGPRYSVAITAFDPERKIQSIKAIREETGLGIADAKTLVEGVPSVVRAGLVRSEAEAVAARLRAQRMTVELREEP